MLPILACLACNGNSDSIEEENNEKDEANEESRIEADESLIGIGTIIKGEWIGDFEGNQLTIVIDEADNNQLRGYNIVKGNKRDVSGTIERNGEVFSVELEEPGDDKWDGIFYTEFNLKKILLSGTWKSNNGKLTKHFNLQKSSKNVDMRIVGNFITNEEWPNTSIVINADRTCSLTESEIYNYETREIELKGSWHSSGDKVTIEWWGSYSGEKKTILRYQRTEGQGNIEGDELLVFVDSDWYVYKI